jgi:hypothetical protein
MNQIIFTHYESTDPLSKQYELENGFIKKEANAKMYQGTASRTTISFDKFHVALESASANEAFGYGTFEKKYPDKVEIVVKGKENYAEDIISRSKENLNYGGPGILMIDYDPSEYGPSMSEHSLIGALIDTHSDIEKSARIIRGSISAGVHIAGELPKTDTGLHLYFPVTNTTDLQKYGETLLDRLWLQGWGYIALGKNGCLLERTCIDGSVFSPERLDFVGKPLIIGSGLEYTPPTIQYTSGTYLDISTIKELTPEESAKVLTLKNDAKKAIQPLATIKKEQWSTDRINEMIASGTTLEEATKTISASMESGCKNLYGDFILNFTCGDVSVEEVLADPMKYDGESLADPIEGKAYGRSTAIYYGNNGNKPLINSLAHGKKTQYYLHSTPPLLTPSLHPSSINYDWEKALNNHVAEFNLIHASVVVGGKHRIMRFESNRDFSNERFYPIFYNRNELSRLYDNTQIKTGEKIVQGKKQDIYKNKFMAWVEHPSSNTFRGGVIFSPGQITPPEYFNTWRGLSVEPKQNDLLLNNINNHIVKIICDNHPDLVDYFINWVAHTFQYPNKPVGTALVLRGEKGCGKGTLGHFLRNIWGVHGLHIASTKYLVGNFNGHFNDICFMFADEAFFSGDKKNEGVLKSLITEPTVIIERKGIDAISQPNYLNIFMATNADFAVPATRDERRYCVLDVSGEKINDRSYFAPLQNDCASREVQAAFLYSMLNVDLSDWHSGDIPETNGLRAQRYHSMNSMQKWVANCLVNEVFDEHQIEGSPWEISLSTQVLFDSYSAWCNREKISEYRRHTMINLSSYLSGIFKKSKHVGSRNVRGFDFGDIDDAIGAFEKYERVNLEELIS